MEKDQPQLPRNALVLVGDGGKAAFLRNVGTPLHPKFKAERLLQHEIPPTRDMGTDRPGRVVAEPGGTRSAVEQTDWHQLEEDRFVRSIAEALSRIVAAEPRTQIVVVLPPKALGNMRAGMDPALRKHVLFELAQDLTGRPIDELEKRFAVGP
jgi:protein required for attachment to host cells